MSSSSSLPIRTLMRSHRMLLHSLWKSKYSYLVLGIFDYKDGQ